MRNLHRLIHLQRVLRALTARIVGAEVGVSYRSQRSLSSFSVAATVLWCQLAVLLALMLPVLLLWPHLLLPVFLGGVLSISMTLYYAVQFFKYSGAQYLQQIVQSMYWGAAKRILLTCLVFFVVLNFFPHLHPGAFVLGFAGVQTGYWLAPFWSA